MGELQRVAPLEINDANATPSTVAVPDLEEVRAVLAQFDAGRVEAEGLVEGGRWAQRRLINVAAWLRGLEQTYRLFPRNTSFGEVARALADVDASREVALEHLPFPCDPAR